MKVYGKCKSCKNEIGYRTNANTRVEFAMQDGEIKKMMTYLRMKKTTNLVSLGTSFIIICLQMSLYKI